MTDLRDINAKSARGNRPPERLTTHLDLTEKSAALIQQRTGRIDAAHTVIPDFWTIARLACLFHDCGKINCEFQRQLAETGYFWAERHEALSLGYLHLIPDSTHRAWAAVGIATHHRALTGENARKTTLATLYQGTDLTEWRDRFEPLPEATAEQLAHWLHETATRRGLPTTAPTAGHSYTTTAHTEFTAFLATWRRRTNPATGLAAVLLQGAVTYADHLASAHGTLNMTQPMNADFARTIKEAFPLKPHQERAAKTPSHLILRARTGSGKTEASWLWCCQQAALLQAEGRGTPRVFYTLPYLASINAMTTRTTEKLGREGLVGPDHSRAGDYWLQQFCCPDDDETTRVQAARDATHRKAATKLFKETIRITTPYQLLRAALVGAAYSSRLIDVANSVFVFDELHAYDTKRLGYILAMMQTLEELGGRIAVLSATMPDALTTLITETLTGDVTCDDDSDSTQQPRHRIETRNHHITDPAALTEITHHLRAGESVLVIANNVAHAQQLYDNLTAALPDHHGTLLHSRYKRGHRGTIEKAITDRYGTDQTRNKTRKGGFVVATQVVEVSLDVDFDVLFTACADLEALAQRFGRINRIRAREAAPVIIHTPRYKQRRGQPGLYCDGIYPHDPVSETWTILNENTGNEIDENEITHWLNRIYNTTWGHKWRQEVLRHRDDFRRAFLTFKRPFDARDQLEERFDEMFDGLEAVMEEDLKNYKEALHQDVDADGKPRISGQLLASEYLIPLPHWGSAKAAYDTNLKVHVIRGAYSDTDGLKAIHNPGGDTGYQLDQLT
ncbi:CRISPR-associated helicase Cas3' [Streptomyces sp. NPDC001339]|uniref:CRISPR-associated helicase Cas3' n=1 Tax=Streptomyces sp. NPDC001339 TaxID=3364563 RepID=UPI0036B6E10D